MLYNILIELRKNIQLYFEGIDYLHIFVAIRFGRQVVAVNSLNIIYIELAVREDDELFLCRNA